MQSFHYSILPDQTSSSLFCLPRLVNASLRYLSFSTCFYDTSPSCREHWTRYLERCSTSVLEVLIFIPAMSHTAAKPSNAYWRPDSEEASKTKSFAKSSRLIFHLLIVTHSLVWLNLPIHIT